MKLKSINLAVILGVRPQFTKTAALQWAIKKHNDKYDTKVHAIYINTGQHYDGELADSQIRDLGIHIDYTLSHKNHHPIHILGNMIIGVYEVLDNISRHPNWVLVNGDATTALAGAIAAARKNLPVVHIEAGMRSGNLIEPEELNRRMIDHIASLHVCTSRIAVENLKNEGIVDTVFWPGDLAFEFIESFSASLPSGIPPYSPGEYVIATLHKADNVNSEATLRTFVHALSKHPRPVIFITHPRTKQRLSDLELLTTKGVDFIDSIPYSEMLSALKGAAFLVTDSGGLHREAYYFQKRCLVRRDSGGWSALIDAGIHRRIGRDLASIENGLNWIEHAVEAGDYPSIQHEDLIKRGANEALLQKLIELTSNVNY